MLHGISIPTLLSMFHLLRYSDGVSRQNALYLTDYCPKFAACNEEPHILCKYYNPDNLMSPRCNLSKVTLTHDVALRIIELCNAMRSKIANGLETGKDGAYFPRGYGMIRLNWDRELATLAQVTANQCSRFRLLACRATLKYHNPSQFLCSISVPHNTKNVEKFLINYITKILKQVYLQKNESSVELVNGFEDHTGWSSIKPKSYFYIIHGPATHIGCALSYFRTTTNKEKTEEHNLLNLICNLSARPASDGSQSVYNTTKPTTYGYSRQCGCKLPYIEDEDCLCNIGSRGNLFCNKNESSCDPSSLVLPIYKENNLSSTKLLSHRKLSKNAVRTSIFSKRKNNKKVLTLPEERQDIDVDIFGNKDDSNYTSDLKSFFDIDVQLDTKDNNETSNKVNAKELIKASNEFDTRMLTVLSQLEKVVKDATLDAREKEAIYTKLRTINGIFEKKYTAPKIDDNYSNNFTSGHSEKMSYKSAINVENLNPILNYDFTENAEINNSREEKMFENTNEIYSSNDKATLYNYKEDKLKEFEKLLKDVNDRKQISIKHDHPTRPVKEIPKPPRIRPILPGYHNLVYVLDSDKLT